MRSERADDEIGGQEMQRRIVQGERGPLASGIERPLQIFAPPGHVAGRQRPQRAGDFLHAQIREMSGFELAQPSGEDGGCVRCHG